MRLLKYLRYWLKNAVLAVIFSPIVLAMLLIALFVALYGWLAHNPHPEETRDEYERRKSGYWRPDW